MMTSFEGKLQATGKKKIVAFTQGLVRRTDREHMRRKLASGFPVQAVFGAITDPPRMSW